MKYRSEITINLPIEKVIEHFDSMENMYKWQPELVSHEHLEGTPGQEGAKTKLHYKLGKREMEMIETITHRNLPHEFTGTYEATGVWNKVENKFTKTDDNKTHWEVNNEFRMNNFMMKMFAFFMPGSFKKQTRKFMLRFKEFAETSAETVS